MVSRYNELMDGFFSWRLESSVEIEYRVRFERDLGLKRCTLGYGTFSLVK
jgi:hypothetical protein